MHVATLLTGLFLAGSALQPGHTQTIEPVDSRCDFGVVVVDWNFAGGQVSGCELRAGHIYSLQFTPENMPINPSPWYAFKVSASTAQQITLELKYTEKEHRYVPKVSHDGDVWQAAPEGMVNLSKDKTTARFALRVGPSPIWVAGQELVTMEDYRVWRNKVSSREFVSEKVLGTSLEARPIYELSSLTAPGGGYVILTGRQHPPEVTGALALFPFAETIWGDSALAREFRSRFNVLLFPNLNPDGVERGHWRHNVGGIDLNRDWGPFSQPETRLMRDRLAKFAMAGSTEGEAVELFLDFHSTRENVLYTQPDGTEMQHFDFGRRWFEAITARKPASMGLVRKPGRNPDKPTSKYYMSSTYGIPGITYEMGDETDRVEIEALATLAAEEMMMLLLEDVKK